MSSPSSSALCAPSPAVAASLRRPPDEGAWLRGVPVAEPPRAPNAAALPLPRGGDVAPEGEVAVAVVAVPSDPPRPLPPRVAALRRTSGRLSSEVPPAPPLDARCHHATYISSPLRPVTAPAAVPPSPRAASAPRLPAAAAVSGPGPGALVPPSAWERLQLGEARYLRRPSDLLGAADAWLQAWHHADRPRLVAELEARLRTTSRPQRERALLKFQIALLSANPAQARRAVRDALVHQPKLERVLLHMLRIGAATPAYAAADAHLRRSFLSLTCETLHRQQDLFHLARLGAWAEASRLADELVLQCPHLLAPRCLSFVAHLHLQEHAAAPVDDAADAARARQVMAFVRELDAAGHVHATGASTPEQYFLSWTFFLELWYVVEPAAFGPVRLRADGTLRELPLRRRVVDGLPMVRALDLPLHQSWDEEVADWRREAHEAVGADDASDCSDLSDGGSSNASDPSDTEEDGGPCLR